MPLWGDPLDDLIDELEQAFPAVPADQIITDLPSFEDVQLWVGAILWGSAEDQARVEGDPRVQAAMAFYSAEGTKAAREKSQT